jgi:hypothetical protein
MKYAAYKAHLTRRISYELYLILNGVPPKQVMAMKRQQDDPELFELPFKVAIDEWDLPGIKTVSKAVLDKRIQGEPIILAGRINGRATARDAASVAEKRREAALKAWRTRRAA